MNSHQICYYRVLVASFYADSLLETVAKFLGRLHIPS